MMRIIPTPNAHRGDEMSRLRRDVLRESHDRDCRIACVLFEEECAAQNLRVLVFGVDTTQRNDHRIRVNVFNVGCFIENDGIALDLLSSKGHIRRLQRSPETNPTVWKTEKIRSASCAFLHCRWVATKGRKRDYS